MTSKKWNVWNGIYDPFGVRLLNRLCLGFINLKEHKFRHNFADTLNPLCQCFLQTQKQSITFYAAKITYHFAQTLLRLINNAIASLYTKIISLE